MYLIPGLSAGDLCRDAPAGDSLRTWSDVQRILIVLGNETDAQRRNPGLSAGVFVFLRVGFPEHFYQQVYSITCAETYGI